LNGVNQKRIICVEKKGRGGGKTGKKERG